MARTVSDAERRARLGRRHHLAAMAPDLEALAGDLVGLHSSDPGTVFLSARARLDGFEVVDLESALYERKSLARVLAMRRTLWVVPTGTVSAVHNSSTVKIAAAEHKRASRMIEDAGIAADGDAWQETVKAATLDAMRRHGEPISAIELRQLVPALQEQIPIYRSDGSELGKMGMSTRMLFGLAASGLVIRARPRGTWISGQYRWAPVEDWLGAPITSMDRSEAQTAVLRSWLRGFGPASEDDITWWTGWTRGEVRRALVALEAVEVSMQDATGYLLPDDLEEVPSTGPWVAFLPGLDPTIMGWKQRAWYLEDLGPILFDNTGNAGPTVWSEGRVVGGWAQDAGGRVRYRLLRDVGAETEAAIGSEAGRLEGWLGGVRVSPRFRSAFERDLANSAAD